MTTRVITFGQIGEIWPHIRKKSNSRAPIHGSGVGLHEGDALLPALGEAIERYCASVYTEGQFILASASELGREALDLDQIPRCSKKELSNPRCGLVAPDKKKPLRWVRGLSLLDGRALYLPAIMVYLFTGYAHAGERIWIPITTGCACYTSFEGAVLRGILEVIERDAISIVWLQKLSLPVIEIDSMPSLLSEYCDRYQRSSKHLKYRFYDATTDLGVPIVYGLQTSTVDEQVSTLVSCSAAVNGPCAVTKVIRDMAGIRRAFRSPIPFPDNLDEFRELFHGASYMAKKERTSAFDFLFQSGQKQLLSRMSSLEGSDEQCLRMLLQRFRRKKLDVYAVDLSCDEAIRAGVRVVRILIPGLQPFSCHYRAQYLGHPRLYELPKLLGYSALPEHRLNVFPQPFA